MLDKVRLRLRSLFRRPNVEFELETELRFHLDQLIEENISSGMPPEEARRAAQRMIGGIAQCKEECRDMLRVNFVEDLVQDVRYTIRSLAKSPGFTGVVVATLALGIGANIAIFTIVHGVLLRPLDYPKPDQLMYLTAEAPAIGGTGSALSAPEYIEFRQMNRSFAAVGAYSTGGAAYTTGEVNLTTGDRPLRVRSISVDAHLLKALSIQPEQGRFFSDEETARWTGTLPPPIAILSHELCEQHLDNDRSLDKRWKSRAAPTKSLALCHLGPTSWITAPRFGCPSGFIRIWPGNARPMSSTSLRD